MCFLAHDDSRVLETVRAEEIRGQGLVPAFVRLSVNLRVTEEAPSPRYGVDLLETDNHNMHMRLAPCVGTPRERAVRERYSHSVSLEQDWPQLPYLLALRNRIRGHEPNATRAPSYECCGLHEPRRHVVQSAATAPQGRYATYLLPLLHTLILCSHERWIAEHVRALLRRQHIRPIDLQSIALHDPRRLAQRNPRIRLPELQAQPIIHEVIHHPERGLRDPRREGTGFDPVKLIDIDPAQARYVQGPLFPRAARCPQLANHLDLQFP